MNQKRIFVSFAGVAIAASLLLIPSLLVPGWASNAQISGTPIVLPLVVRDYPVAQAPSPTATLPQGIALGNWSGTTSRGHPMSFVVSQGSLQWSSFTLKTDFSSSNCGVNGNTEITVNGPGNIMEDQFSGGTSTFSFSGQFNSATTATGDYAFNNYLIVISLPGPPYICNFYLTQSGTWTASWPAAASPTPTQTQSVPPPSTNTPTPTPTPTQTTPPESPPVSGHWDGLTSRGHPMGFDVTGDGSQWQNFSVKTDFSAPDCGAEGTVEVTLSGPGNIANGQFGNSSGTFTFNGQFTSPITAEGDYAFNNHQVVIGLPGPPWICYYYLTQSGTWLAAGP